MDNNLSDKVPINPTSVQTTNNNNNRSRLNMNQNFILVPAGSTASMFQNNGNNLSNLIATHHNSIINKGKIMILTTAQPAAQIGANQNVTTISNVATPIINTNTSLTNQVLRQQTANQPQLTIQASSSDSSAAYVGSQIGVTSNHQVSQVTNNPNVINITNLKIAPNSVGLSTIPLAIGSNVSGLVFNQAHRTTPTVSNSSIPMTVSSLPVSSVETISKKSAIQVLTATPAQIQTQLPIQSQQRLNRVPIVPISSQVHARSSYPIMSVAKSSIPIKPSNNNRVAFSKNKASLFSKVTKPSPSVQVMTPTISSISLAETNTTDSKDIIELSEEIESFEQSSINETAEKVEKAKDVEIISLRSEKKEPHKPGLPLREGDRLYSEETLDRASPELWPELVPGVLNFLANSSPVYNDDSDNEETHDDSYDDEEFEIQRKKLKNSNNQINLAAIVQKEILDDDSLDQPNSMPIKVKKSTNESPNAKKLIKTFSMTPYGLESIQTKANFDSDASNDSDSNSSSSSHSPKFVSINNNNNNRINQSSSSSFNKNKSDWHKDFDEEEIAMIYGFGSLTGNALYEKINEIQNIAYQLGLEEEHEIARARYLDLLNEPNVPHPDDYPSLTFEHEIDLLLSSEIDSKRIENVSNTT